MARTARKEKVLTPEEKMAQALVPDVEQPYRVPENWCWGYLTASFAECKDSYRKPINATERAGRIGTIPYYGATGQVGWIDDYLTDEELVLLGEDGAPFLDLIKDKAYLISGKAWVNNHAHILKSFFGHAGNLYLLHYLNAFNYTGYVNGTTRLKLTQSSMDTIPVPIAPFAEQQRIVDRIESMFAKLDEAKEKAQAVVDGFEDRRAAILHKAFTGDLTGDWREQHGFSRNIWEPVRLSDICTVNPNKASTKDLPDDLEVSFFPMPALSEVYGAITEPQTRKLGEVRTGFTNFSEGDVVFAKITPCMENGKSAVIGPLVNNLGFGTTEFFVLRCGERLYNRYLWHMVRDRSFRNEAKSVMSGAVGQQRVPKSFLENYPLQLPSIEEQKEIVRILDNLFTKEQQAKEIAEQLIDQIDAMKKSILARAFRGELGTNDPNDESAVELLKRVLEDNTNDEHAKPNKKRTIIPKTLEQQLSNGLERDLVLFMLKANTDSVSMKDLMSISSKKFELMDTIRKLEKKGILKKDDSGQYCLGAQEK